MPNRPALATALATAASAHFRRVVAALALLLALLPARGAAASVRKDGAWPPSEKAVSFQYQGQREGGLTKLAEQAGWSLVISDRASVYSPHVLTLSLKDQAPADVLDALLEDGAFVAVRKGSLVRIDLLDAGAGEPGAGDAAPLAKSPPPADADAEDMKVMGGDGAVEKGRVVRNLTVMGGHCDVYGRVTGDVSVMGGSVVIHEGAVVEHDVSTMGGHIEIRAGADVRGHASTLGGSIEDASGARVSGHVKGASVGKSARAADKGVLRRLSDALANTALLFLLGVVFLAVAPARMESLRLEVARAPMKQVGLGVVGLGGFLLGVVLLCVTVVGLPLAGVALLLGVVALYASLVAALTTLGAGLVRHKSENPYVHLAVGCLVFLIASPLPWIGPWLVFALVLLAVGTLVSTRVAGFFPTKKRGAERELAEPPYR